MNAARPLILVTSFEPFGGSPVNPTMRIAEILQKRPFAPGSLEFATLPVVTGVSQGSAWARLAPALEALAPDAVVSLGESAKAERINIERIALNLRDARIADNAGTQLRDQPVVEGAPDARFATLPVRALVDACLAAGVDAELSLSAGTYLCNEIMFRTLDDAATRTLPRRSGFIHVPQLPEQSAARGGPSMPAESSARGVHAALVQLATLLAESRA
ncbi:MAG: pyroglutamyl-peptidase I [Phycisphaerales bacterium]